MHAMTDLDAEKYRHPDTARARRRDTYADHGVPESERTRPRRPPHPLAAVPALGGRGVDPAARRRGARDRRRPLVRSCTRPGTRSATSACGARRVGCSCPATTCCRGSRRRSRSSAASTPTRCAATSTRCGGSADLRPRFVLSGARHARSATRSRASRRSCATSCGGWRRSTGRSGTGPRTVVELADLLVAKAILAHQRQLAINETLAHIAYLRWSGMVERRIRPDGVYEWYRDQRRPAGPARAGRRVLTRGGPVDNELVDRRGLWITTSSFSTMARR